MRSAGFQPADICHRQSGRAVPALGRNQRRDAAATLAFARRVFRRAQIGLPSRSFSKGWFLLEPRDGGQFYPGPFLPTICLWRRGATGSIVSAAVLPIFFSPVPSHRCRVSQSRAGVLPARGGLLWARPACGNGSVFETVAQASSLQMAVRWQPTVPPPRTRSFLCHRSPLTWAGRPCHVARASRPWARGEEHGQDAHATRAATDRKMPPRGGILMLGLLRRTLSFQSCPLRFRSGALRWSAFQSSFAAFRQ